MEPLTSLPSVFRESTVTLARAVELIDAAIQPQDSTPATQPDLDRLAATVSALVPLLVVENGVARYLRDGERPAKANLAVSHDAIARVIRILMGAAVRS